MKMGISNRVPNGERDFKKGEKYMDVITRDTLTPKRNINVLFALTHSTLTNIKVASYSNQHI